MSKLAIDKIMTSGYGADTTLQGAIHMGYRLNENGELLEELSVLEGGSDLHEDNSRQASVTSSGMTLRMCGIHPAGSVGLPSGGGRNPLGGPVDRLIDPVGAEIQRREKSAVAVIERPRRRGR